MRRTSHRYRSRTVLSVVVILATALTPGAAAGPVPPGVAEGLTVTVPTGDELLAPPYLSPAVGGVIAPRPLVASVRGWTTVVPVSENNPNLTVLAGALVAGTAVLDAATGAVRVRAGAPGARLV